MQAKVLDALPLVSILINNYNYGHFLAEAIDSALNQTYPNKEVVVVDDGSTDHSREIIADYGDAIVPVLKANGGQASAFNAGFAASRGEIICFLDADDLFRPHKVAAIVEALKNEQESAWCFHPLELVDFAKNPSAALESSHGDADIQSQSCDVRSAMRQGGKGLRQKISLPATSGLCFTRTLLEQILPMPEAEGIALGDTYLQFTAIALAQGFVIDSKLAIQRLHASNLYTRNANRKAAAAR
ncbi:MAG: glycosyltransferase, partial [Leptolyngbyaceae cyanobacterium CAN_BIN12]|nr:glycosyltransferase [Leptolyngbyaceae cyanobacterium CAN_BIN12]